MKLTQNRIAASPAHGSCFVHARAAFCEGGFSLITTQPLRLSGSDVFYGLHLLKSFDGGKTWGKPEPSRSIVRKPFGEKTEIVFADATPTFHRKTGKILLTGLGNLYENDAPVISARCYPVYAVYDFDKGDFCDFRILELGDDKTYYRCGSGCCQVFEEENGDLLLPVYYTDKAGAADLRHSCMKSVVLRCAFDGDVLSVKEIGESLSVKVPRGLYEPSVTKHEGRYFLAMRNDETGYIASSEDGLRYDSPLPLCFEDGESVGNYNTQQHWLTVGGKLFLVYTRRDASNEHVFRHRAPLFAAEFDVGRMCILKSTERIVVPERGARLGNFGCVSLPSGEGFVTAAEWMQSVVNEDPWAECAKYGSDNSIWLAKLLP